MQLKALIIEDEPAAARRLENMIKVAEPEIEIIGRLDSVSSSVKWFKNNPHPDLLFLDINLGDGLSFSIFDQVEIRCPVIFTTAFDEYAIKAFKLNSIDYLLKPIKQQDLKFSLDKFKKHHYDSHFQIQSIKALLQTLQNPDEPWKKRFIVNFGDKIKAIETNEIAYFMIMEKNTFLLTRNDEQYGVNYSLEQLESILNPADFFRVNRKYMVSFTCIRNMWSYSRSRVKLQINPPAPEDVIVSTDRSAQFKEWLNK